MFARQGLLPWDPLGTDEHHSARAPCYFGTPWDDRYRGNQTDALAAPSCLHPKPVDRPQPVFRHQEVHAAGCLWKPSDAHHRVNQLGAGRQSPSVRADLLSSASPFVHLILISAVHSYAASQHFFTATVGPTVTTKTSSTARKLQFHDPARAIRGHVSAFSYMVRQTNNSGLLAILYMVRQAKSGKLLCLGTQDK